MTEYFSLGDIFLETRPWPDSADVQRLDAAFQRLNAAGVLALHNGPCCSTCVGGFIWGEAVPAAEEVGRPFIGYVFYHEQTSADVAEGEDLYLVCGPVPEPEDKTAFRVATNRVTALVQQELKGAGLAAEPTEEGSCVLRVSLNLES